VQGGWTLVSCTFASCWDGKAFEILVVDCRITLWLRVHLHRAGMAKHSRSLLLIAESHSRPSRRYLGESRVSTGGAFILRTRPWLMLVALKFQRQALGCTIVRMLLLCNRCLHLGCPMASSLNRCMHSERYMWLVQVSSVTLQYERLWQSRVEFVSSKWLGEKYSHSTHVCSAWKTWCSHLLRSNLTKITWILHWVGIVE
jgi:hypothetical protein